MNEDFLDKILYGTGDEVIDFEYKSAFGTRTNNIPFEGVIPTLERRHKETKSPSMIEWYEMYMSEMDCPICKGARLKPEVLNVKVGKLNIKDLCDLSIIHIKEYIDKLKFTEKEKITKCSFRSRGSFPASKVAGDHFNGGGHLNAAGGESPLSISETIKKFVSILPQYEQYIEK